MKRQRGGMKREKRQIQYREEVKRIEQRESSKKIKKIQSFVILVLYG